jgi:transformation/transcription domain-associated protein
MLSFAKETRKRNLAFCIPATVQIAPTLRLEHNAVAEVYFSDIYDQHCEDMGISREEPAIHIIEKLKQARREFKQVHGRDVRTKPVNIIDQLLSCSADG